jgi:hypothetical protein
VFIKNLANRLSIVWLTFFVISTAGASDLQTILDKHLKALGGRDAIAAVKSVKAFSSLEYMGMVGETVSIIKFPSQYYTHLDLGVITEDKGFDGITAWTTDQNGITRRDSPEELKPVINELYLAGYSYLLAGRNNGRVEYRGDTLIGEGEYHQLAMFPEGGDSLIAFINVTTGRLEYRSEIVTGIRMNTSYSDFRKIAGIETHFAFQVETVGAPYELTSWIDSIQVNPEIPDSLFFMPGETLRDFDFPPATDRVDLPLRIKGHSLFVEVLVNGQGPFYLLLDSGSGSTVLSHRLAEQMEIELSGAIPARGVGGYGSMGYGVIDSINLGPVSWRLSRVTVFDFSPLTGGRLATVDGILGYDFFIRFPMLIDSKNAVLTLFNPAEEKLPELGEAVDMDIYLQIPVLDVELDGYPVRLAFDLGAEMGLVVQDYSRWYKERSGSLDKSVMTARIQGVGGVQDAKIYLGDSLRINQLLIEKPEVMVVEDFDAIPFPDYIEGFLGMDILKNYILFINFPERKLSFLGKI